jgi:uridine phosphorylase
VLDNVLDVSSDTGEFDPETQIDHGGDEIAQLAHLANETIRILHERNL